jgi:hypothetical protein
VSLILNGSASSSTVRGGNVNLQGAEKVRSLQKAHTLGGGVDFAVSMGQGEELRAQTGHARWLPAIMLLMLPLK